MTSRTVAVVAFVVASFLGCSRTTSSKPVVLAPDTDQNRVVRVQIATRGSSVNDFEVATLWSANGQQLLDDGSVPDLQSDDAVSEFWNDEGQMTPNPNRLASHVSDAIYEIEVTKERPHVAYAIDSRRNLGGLVVATAESDEQLTINLKPLVRVHGEIRFQGAIPNWSYACFFPGGVKETPG